MGPAPHATLDAEAASTLSQVWEQLAQTLCVPDEQIRRGQGASVRNKWRAMDQHHALAEGWCVIFADETHMEIQRDDDQDVFKTDDAAKRYVRRCAKAGSRFHTRALAYVRKGD